MIINVEEKVTEIMYDYLLNYSIKEELTKYIKNIITNINKIQKHIPVLYIGIYEDIHILGYSEIEVLNKSKDHNVRFNILPIYL